MGYRLPEDWRGVVSGVLWFDGGRWRGKRALCFVRRAGDSCESGGVMIGSVSEYLS